MTSTCHHTRIHTAKHLLLALLTLIAGCVLTVSCSHEEVDNTDTGKVRIKLLAGAELSRHATPETEVTQAQALVFISNGSEYLYHYTVPSTAITDIGNNATSFSLLLATETRAVKLYIVANANDAITANQPQAGDTESTVRQLIVENFTADGISGSLPMWGEYELPSGISTSLNNAIVNLNVLRAVARADVTTDQVSSLFSMVSIQAFRANSLMQVAPDSYTGSLLVSEPSIPAGSTTTINTNPITTTATSSIAQLYLPEAEAPELASLLSDACCVVVGGTYNGSSVVTYYRLDFEPDVADYPPGQILRNHHYTFNITSVSAPGWSTPEEAANNQPMGIEVTVVDWTLKSMYENIGGQDFFFISVREVIVAGSAGSLTYLDVSTSIPDYTLQFSDALGNPTGVPADSINNGAFIVAKSGASSLLVQALNDNPLGNGPLEYHVLIVAGRSQILLTIEQDEE